MEKKIVVIGGGLAGLSAAHRIEKLTGLKVDLFEARSRLGGRVYTVRVGNSYEELGGKSLTDGGEAKHIRALIEEMGLQTTGGKWDISCRQYVYLGKCVSCETVFEGTPIPDPFHFSLLEKYCSEATNFGEVLDRFLGTNNLQRHVAELRMRGFEGNDSKDLSVFYLSSFWDSYCSNYAKKDKKSEYSAEWVEGGNSHLIEKLGASLQGMIHYGHALHKISQTESGRILLAFKNGQQVLADYLVLSLPCSTLRDVEIEEGMFPEDQMRAIQTLQYGSNAKILFLILSDEMTPGLFNTEDSIGWFNHDRSILTLYFGGCAGYFDASSQNTLSNASIPKWSFSRIFERDSFCELQPTSWSQLDSPGVFQGELFELGRGPIRFFQ
jgi:monoamine oxidase